MFNFICFFAENTIFVSSWNDSFQFFSSPCSDQFQNNINNLSVPPPSYTQSHHIITHSPLVKRNVPTTIQNTVGMGRSSPLIHKNASPRMTPKSNGPPKMNTKGISVQVMNYKRDGALTPPPYHLSKSQGPQKGRPAHNQRSSSDSYGPNEG